MNSLLIFPEELKSQNKAVLVGKRASYTREFHGLTKGIKIRATFWNRGLGSAEVIESSAERIVLKTRILKKITKSSHTELIVAVPRPQTVKKIVSTAAMMGVTKVHFIRAERCEKSYLTSNALTEEAIKEEIIKGLEQAYACNPPHVTIHQRFKPFIQDYLSTYLKQHKKQKVVGLIADTTKESKSSLAQVKISKSSFVMIAIGPELGWNKFELGLFKDCGFQAISLGPRILRVEVAATAMLAQVDLLRTLSHKKTHLPHSR